MSQVLAINSRQSFQGRPIGQPMNMCTPVWNKGPRIVRTDINWADYGASSLNQQIGIYLNLLGQGQVTTALDAIRSVYIDNTFSEVAVYVQAVDTLFTVICPANAVVMSPFATSLQEAVIYAEGFVDGKIPTTSIHFMNVEKQGYVLATNFEVAANVTNTDTRFDSSGLSVISFSNVSLGAPASDRLVVALAQVYRVGGTSISSLTLDASPMTLVQGAGGVDTIWSGIYQIPESVLSTANFTLTCSAVATRAQLSIFRIVNLESQTAVSADFSRTAGLYGNVPIDVQKNGVLIGGSVAETSTGANTIAMTGINQQFDWSASANSAFAGGSYNVLANENGRLIEALKTGTATGDINVIGAAWR